MVRARRSAYEVVVTVAVVALTVVMAAGLYAKDVELKKERLMVQELSAMRSSLILYKMINRRGAEGLEELVRERFEAGGVRRPYIDRLPPSDGGEIIDPFGSPYSYDPKAGWVSSTTPGFEGW